MAMGGEEERVSSVCKWCWRKGGVVGGGHANRSRLWGPELEVRRLRVWHTPHRNARRPQSDEMNRLKLQHRAEAPCWFLPSFFARFQGLAPDLPITESRAVPNNFLITSARGNERRRREQGARLGFPCSLRQPGRWAVVRWVQMGVEERRREGEGDRWWPSRMGCN